MTQRSKFPADFKGTIRVSYRASKRKQKRCGGAARNDEF
jgi:hypothetical protein